jgi:hypothetical protein
MNQMFPKQIFHCRVPDGKESDVRDDKIQKSKSRSGFRQMMVMHVLR